LYESSANLRRLLPCRSNPSMKSPFQMRTQQVPSLKWVHRVGCLILALVPKERRGSNDLKVAPGWLIGQTRSGRGWRVWFDTSLPRIDIREVISGTACDHIVYKARQRFDIAGYWCNRVPRSVRTESVDLSRERDRQLIAWFDEQAESKGSSGPWRPVPAAARKQLKAQSKCIRDTAQRIAEAEDREDAKRSIGDKHNRTVAAAERLRDAMGSSAMHTKTVTAAGRLRDAMGPSAMRRVPVAAVQSPVKETLAATEECVTQSTADGTEYTREQLMAVTKQRQLERATRDASTAQCATDSNMQPTGANRGTSALQPCSTATEETVPAENENGSKGVGVPTEHATQRLVRPRRPINRPAQFVAEPARAGRSQMEHREPEDDGIYLLAESKRLDALQATLEEMTDEVRFRQWQDTLQAEQNTMQCGMASGPEIMTVQELENVLVTGLEGNVWGCQGDSLVDRFGMHALTALMTAINPEVKDTLPVQSRMGADADKGVPMSEPTPVSTSTALPLTLEQHAMVSQYKVPKRRHELLRLPEELQRVYHAAEAREVFAQEHVYKLLHRVERSTVPKGEQVFRGTMAYKVKDPGEQLTHGGVRARACCIGTKMRTLLANWQMFSPTVNIDSVRMICAVVPSLCLDLMKWDAHFAFGNSRRGKPFYMELYRGHEEPVARVLERGDIKDTRGGDPAQTTIYDLDALKAMKDPVFEVWGNMQGTPDASKIWNETFSDEFENRQGARRFSEADCEVWIIFQEGADGTGELILLGVHVDDVISAETPGSGASITLFKGRKEMLKRKDEASRVARKQEAERMLAGVPKPEKMEFTSEHPSKHGPVGLRLPFDSEPLDGALGLNIEVRQGAVALSLKDYIKKSTAQLFGGKTPSQVHSPRTPMEQGEYLTTADCPRSPEDFAVVQHKIDQLPFEFDFRVWLGKLGYAAHVLMFPVAVAASNCGRVAGKGGSVPGINMLVRAVKWGFGTAGYAFEVVYTLQRKENLWYLNRLLVSADASAPTRKMTSSLMRLDPKLTSARMGYTAVMNGGVIGYGTGLTAKPVSGAPSGETFALHFATRRIRSFLKFLSYMAKHGVYVPHFEHYAPVIIQQDCQAVQFALHTPKPRMLLQAELLQIANMQQDCKDGLYDTQDTPSGDMASDILTKGLAGAAFANGVALNAGSRQWRPIDRERENYRARKCRRCYGEWLVHERDEQFRCMVGVCKRCGVRTMS
jgi:hypothetical protein